MGPSWERVTRGQRADENRGKMTDGLRTCEEGERENKQIETLAKMRSES